MAMHRPMRLHAEPIRTACLVLRPLQVEDAGPMSRALADPSLYEHIGGAPPSEEELETRHRRLQAGGSEDGTETWLNWSIRLAATDEVVGRVEATIFAGTGQCNVAWIVGRPWQGRGYAREAAVAMAQWLVAHDVRDLVAHIAPGHLRSEAVAIAASFEVTDQVHDGERTWKRRQSARNAGVDAPPA
jgi:RimJ/RimL family protein N-acetyltransferase